MLHGRELSRVRRSIGFLFQNAALFDSISVGENVAFPMRRHTRYAESEIRRRVTEKLARGRAGAASTTRCRRRCREACASAPGSPARWRSIRDPARRRAERRARSDYRRRDRRPAPRAEEGVGYDPRHGDPQHPERAAARRRAGDAPEGPDRGPRHSRGSRSQRRPARTRVHVVTTPGMRIL